MRQNRKPIRKYKGMSERKQGECLEQFENLMFRYVVGDTKAEVLLTLKQVERIVNKAIVTERAEIHAEFEPEPATRLKRKVGTLLANRNVDMQYIKR